MPPRIPSDLQLKFPELLDLIVKSESMNDEERQYWIDILPIMTVEQITQLQGILQNERDQLAAIDAKYATEIEKINEAQRPLQDIQDARRKQQQQRSTQEEATRSAEEVAAEEILKKME